MSNWKVNKHIDVSGIVALLGVFGFLLGWGVSIETRLASKASLEKIDAVIRSVRMEDEEKLHTLKEELDSDIQRLQDLLYQSRSRPP